MVPRYSLVVSIQVKQIENAYAQFGLQKIKTDDFEIYISSLFTGLKIK